MRFKLQCPCCSAPATASALHAWCCWRRCFCDEALPMCRCATCFPAVSIASFSAFGSNRVTHHLSIAPAASVQQCMRRLGFEDRVSDCFYVLHGSFQDALGSRHAFSDIASLRELSAGAPDDLREVSPLPCLPWTGLWSGPMVCAVDVESRSGLFSSRPGSASDSGGASNVPSQPAAMVPSCASRGARIAPRSWAIQDAGPGAMLARVRGGGAGGHLRQ